MNNFDTLCKSLFDSCDLAIIVTDRQLELPGPKILYVNPKLCSNMLYDQAQVVGETPRMFQGPKTERAVLEKLKDDLSQDRNFDGYTINYRSDGSEVYLRWTIISLKAFNNSYFVAVQELYTPGTVVEWIQKIKELQKDIIGRLDKIPN